MASRDAHAQPGDGGTPRVARGAHPDDLRALGDLARFCDPGTLERSVAKAKRVIDARAK